MSRFVLQSYYFGDCCTNVTVIIPGIKRFCTTLICFFSMNIVQDFIGPLHLGQSKCVKCKCGHLYFQTEETFPKVMITFHSVHYFGLI